MNWGNISLEHFPIAVISLVVAVAFIGSAIVTFQIIWNTEKKLKKHAARAYAAKLFSLEDRRRRRHF